MSNRKLFYESILIHLLAWWGVIILGQASFMHSVENSPQWFVIRLARAALAVGIVLAWARWRKIAWQDIGLGNQHFWRNGAIAFGSVVVLWLTVVLIRGTPLWAPNPIGYEMRILAVVTALVNVLAQQLPTFGLLQGFGMKHWNPIAAFALAWCSFSLAHLIGNSLPTILLATVVGLIFGALLQRTKNLGAGLGIHFAFYFMLAILGWGA